MYFKQILEPRDDIKAILGKIKLLQVFQLFSAGITQIPVVNDDNEVQGVITLEGMHKALCDKTPLDAEITSYMEEGIKIDCKTNLSELRKYPLDKLIAVKEKNLCAGAISLNKMFSALLMNMDNASSNLNAIMAASNNGIVSIDADCKINYINKSAANIIGRNEEDVLGQSILKVIPNSRLPQVLQSGESEIGWHFTLGGQDYITNRTPVIQDGKAVGALAVFQDVIEINTILGELSNVKDYKEILETVVENDYDCIVVVDADGYITMFNRAYEEFLDIPREKALGKHVTEVIENSRMHIVVKTGIAEMAQIQKIRGHEMVCNRIPIIKDGKIWGAFGKTMFKDMREFTSLTQKLQTQLEYYKNMVEGMNIAHYAFENIIGSSPEMTEVKNMAQRVAQSNSTVLVQGESGTGKELFAHAIHYASLRKEHPFIKVNCAAIPDSLLESELFGYNEGAFTGAKKGGKLGKFELADKGTIFLDEIGDMPLNMQVKLLRVLQEKEIERVGGTRTIPIDVRVIVATHRDLEELIREGKFRLDLYYRLNVVELKIPPLRRHKHDLMEIIHYLLGKLSSKMGCPVPFIGDDALLCLENYVWPGNVRELENVLERSLNFMENGIIKKSDLPYHIRNYQQGKEQKSLELKDLLEETERIAIINSLKRYSGNKLKAAEALGISRASMYMKINKYGIE